MAYKNRMHQMVQEVSSYLFVQKLYNTMIISRQCKCLHSFVFRVGVQIGADCSYIYTLCTHGRQTHHISLYLVDNDREQDYIPSEQNLIPHKRILYAVKLLALKFPAGLFPRTSFMPPFNSLSTILFNTNSTAMHLTTNGTQKNFNRR